MGLGTVKADHEALVSPSKAQSHTGWNRQTGLVPALPDCDNDVENSVTAMNAINAGTRGEPPLVGETRRPAAFSSPGSARRPIHPLPGEEP